MAAQYGAHEILEVHEVLCDAIDCVNQFQLYRPHVQDGQLMQILDNQLGFIADEYNMMVQMLNGEGMGQAVPYRAPKNFTPSYGLKNPGPLAPNQSPDQMDDRDVASGVLGCHKASAQLKMLASLECANPQIRRMLQQGAINCGEQAYEVWQYMNQRGYYQVPTMKEMTTNTVMESYSTAPNAQYGGMPQ